MICFGWSRDPGSHLWREVTAKRKILLMALFSVMAHTEPWGKSSDPHGDHECLGINKQAILPPNQCCLGKSSLMVHLRRSVDLAPWHWSAPDHSGLQLRGDSRSDLWKVRDMEDGDPRTSLVINSSLGGQKASQTHCQQRS
ncbi:hypothetical protein NPIL_628021 [Nephila pilipes]|uniref:Uncharacterized protein n=1 Tax=Nephila pilipes TaxID=299642 RepID=A0A8X6MW03_NEPPI|nr:hypothetical protein NPIL_628021 [Nephila pilipes]